MSADLLLRRAAKTLREHATEVVIEGPWKYRDRSDDPESYPWTVWAKRSRCSAGTGFAPGTARYIALMHPPVALALAAWLETFAMNHENYIDSYGPDNVAGWSEAVGLARAILREPEVRRTPMIQRPGGAA